MALKSEVLSQKIKNKGNFNYREFYSLCQELLKDQGYQISEDEYEEKIESRGKYVVFKWQAKKKITDYFKNIIELNLRILGMSDVEVEREGKKESMNKGDLTLKVKAILEKDYEDRWEKQPLWKFLRGMYEKYIIRTTAEEYEDRLDEETREIIDQIKSFLQLSTH